MKKHLSTIILILVFLVGLSLLLYPSVADWWNSMTQSQAVASYSKAVASIDNSIYDEMLAQSQRYNQMLAQRPFSLELTEDEKVEYNSVLDVTGTGIMSYIDIPSIRVELPIYHGTSEGVLQIAIGHLEGTSLPVGGTGTHCVISGHRGLPSARLFTDIDRLVVGDEFMLRTLDETLTYEVDQIQIVLPYELSNIQIDPNQDYCTLVTCTPYGVNSHRLLVRGHRVDTVEGPRKVRVTADAIQIRPVQVAPFVAAPMLLILLILLFTAKTDPNDFDDDPDKGGIFRA